MKKKIVLYIFCLLVCYFTAPISFASENIRSSAWAVIDMYKKKDDWNTSCSDYVRKVLINSGIIVAPFYANEFDRVISKKLPDWKVRSFYAGANKARATLRDFLNGRPDNSIFLAQWKREDESGHVAIIIKNRNDNFGIFQAQLGLRRPHYKVAKIESLLYLPNDYGDRSNLKLFFVGPLPK